jgi:hypothetical protein
LHSGLVDRTVTLPRACQIEKGRRRYAVVFGKHFLLRRRTSLILGWSRSHGEPESLRLLGDFRRRLLIKPIQIQQLDDILNQSFHCYPRRRPSQVCKVMKASKLQGLPRG